MDSLTKNVEDKCFTLETHRFCIHEKAAELPDLMLINEQELVDEILPGAKRQRTQKRAASLVEVHSTDSDTSKKDLSSPLDAIPDDVLSIILTHTAADTCSPGDFINLLLTSRRICHLGQQPQVLRGLPLKALQVAASDWCPSALKFLSRCCQSGSPSASYALGMIAFYCLGRPSWGSRLLAQSALARCPEALYSLAVIHFNGSGATKEHRDVPAGVALCMQAASLGHTDATRELGHCFQDGYGVPRDPAQGRQLLMRANVQDAAEALKAGAVQHHHHHACCSHSANPGCPETRLGQIQPSPEESRLLEAGPQEVVMLPPSQPISRWRRRSRSKACLGPLARSMSAPPVLRSPEPHFSLFNNSEDFPPLPLPASSQPKTTCAVNLNLNLSLAQSMGTPTPQGSFRNPVSSAAQQTEPQVQVPAGGEQHLLRQSTEQEHAGSNPNVGALAAGLEANQGHQCFCLPAVSLPLRARKDGWVRLFMLDWHYLVEAGEIECLTLDKERAPEAEGDRMCCSNPTCGRIETRENEFRCCSACTEARYCSRVCQAQDWKMGHKGICARLVELQLLQQDAEE